MKIKIERTPDYLDDDHLNKGTRQYLKVLNASDTPVESLSPEEARRVLAKIQEDVNVDVSGITECEQYITEDNYTIKLTIVRPEGATDKLPAFVFVHGGGWVLGDYPTHRRLVRDLVVESGYACVFVNYTPSPEVKFPIALNQVYAATKWVASNGAQVDIDGSRLALVGNSAGGNMALAASMMARQNGNSPVIKALVLLWPVTDASGGCDSYKLYGKDRFLTKPLMDWMFDQYMTGREDRDNILLSPLRASVEDLRGLPPTLIEVAENDILRDEGEAMGRKLDEAGVDVTTIRYNGVIHDWGMLNGFAQLPEVKSLVTFTSAMLKKHLL